MPQLAVLVVLLFVVSQGCWCLIPAESVTCFFNNTTYLVRQAKDSNTWVPTSVFVLENFALSQGNTLYGLAVDSRRSVFLNFAGNYSLNRQGISNTKTNMVAKFSWRGELEKVHQSSSNEYLGFFLQADDSYFISKTKNVFSDALTSIYHFDETSAQVSDYEAVFKNSDPHNNATTIKFLFSAVPSIRQILIEFQGNISFAAAVPTEAQTIMQTEIGNEYNLLMAIFDSRFENVLRLQKIGSKTASCKESKSVLVDNSIVSVGRCRGFGAFQGAKFKTISAFVAKLSLEGQIEWTIETTALSGNTSAIFWSVESDSSYIYAAGEFKGVLTIGKEQLKALDKKGLIVKIDSNGSIVWARVYPEAIMDISTLSLRLLAFMTRTSLLFADSTSGSITNRQEISSDNVHLIHRDNTLYVSGKLTGTVQLTQGLSISPSYWDILLLAMRRNCSCLDPHCMIPFCAGLDPMNKLSCLERGFCTESNKCSCEANKFTGSLCQDVICGNYSSSDPQVCSSHGECSLQFGNAKCMCVQGYSGDFCSDTSCYGHQADSPLVCNGNGACKAYNSCKCNANYTGLQCDIPVMYTAPRCEGGQKMIPLSSYEFKEHDLRHVAEEIAIASHGRQHYIASANATHFTIFEIDGNSVSAVLHQEAGRETAPGKQPWDMTKTVAGDLYTIVLQGKALKELESIVVRQSNNSEVFQYRCSNEFGCLLESITSDAAGNLYIAGSYVGEPPIFAGCELSYASLRSGFIIMLDANMHCKWSYVLSSASFRLSKIMYSSLNNTLVLAGVFNTALKLGDVSLTAIGTSVFLANLSLNGNNLPHSKWTFQLFGTAKSISSYTLFGLHSDRYGMIYLAATFFNSTVRLDSSSVTTASNNILIAKLDQTGGLIWIRQTYGEYQDVGSSTLEEDSGKLILSGRFKGSVVLTNDREQYNYTLMSLESRTTFFVSSFDTTTGDCTWASAIYSQVDTDPVCKLSIAGISYQVALLCNGNATLWTAENYECEECPPGTYANAGSLVCDPCPAGTYSSHGRTAQCSSCSFVSSTILRLSRSNGLHSNSICLALDYSIGIITGIVGLLISVLILSTTGVCGIRIHKRVKKLLAVKDQLEFLQIRWSDISFIDFKEDGKPKPRFTNGAHGKVYVAYYEKTKKVAVKVSKILQSADTQQELENIRNEFIKSLTGCEYIAKGYGFIVGDPVATDKISRKNAIVLKFYENGSLGDLMNKMNRRKISLTQAQVFQLVKGIVEGMRHLHNKDLIHADLKPENILLSKDYKPKISDFGISIFRSKETAKKEKIGGSGEYRAPELLKEQQPTKLEDLKKCDVYSFGVMCEQLLSCVEEMTLPEDNTFPALRTLFKKCRSNEPSARPSFDQVLEMVNNTTNEPSETQPLLLN